MKPSTPKTELPPSTPLRKQLPEVPKMRNFGQRPRMCKNRKVSVLALIMAGLVLGSGWMTVSRAADDKESKLAAWKADIAKKEAIVSKRFKTAAPKGKYYEAEVPDTLDLAERGALCVNFLTGMVDPEHGYELYVGSSYFTSPSIMYHGNIGGYLDMPKAIEALPQARLMSGSKQNLDIERGLMLRIMALSWDDGLLFSPVISQPWVTNFVQDACHVPLIPRLMLGMMYWHEYDGNPFWLEHAKKIFDTIRAKIIHYDGPEYAYVPSDTIGGVGGLTGGWNLPKSYFPDKVSGVDYSFGIFVLGGYLRAVSKYAELTGDKDALELARKMVNTLRRPQFWKEQTDRAFGTTDFQHFFGMALRGLLDYARITNDAELKEFARTGYEHARRWGIPEIGWWPQECVDSYPWTEYDNIADMAVLAVKLSDSGVGDYWEDVDCYVRNHMVEAQLVDRKQLEASVAAAPKYTVNTAGGETGDRVIERSLGCFDAAANVVDFNRPWSYCCCNNNGAQGLYHVWQSIVQDKGDGVAQVNLLLNRASKLLDVNSYLPYEGKVVVKNKAAKKVRLRLPLWASRSDVRCRVGSKSARPEWFGNYLVFDGLKPGAEIVVEFPMIERTIQRTVKALKQTYTIHIRGNTVIDISPRGTPPQYRRTGDPWGGGSGKVYPPPNETEGCVYKFYLRDHLRANKAPMVKKMRFAPERIIRP